MLTGAVLDSVIFGNKCFTYILEIIDNSTKSPFIYSQPRLYDFLIGTIKKNVAIQKLVMTSYLE